jgi:hypothetical protein
LSGKSTRRDPIKPRYRNDVGKYVVEIWSQTLYELKKPVDLDKLKKYIEHRERCMAADSSIQKGVLRRVGTQLS